MNESERQPHAYLDLPSRRLKGLKIERLLDLVSYKQQLKMLEIGTGSGGIAHYFGSHPSKRFEVDAVDVCDNRVVEEGYRYTQINSTDLPFPDETFDIVLTNHVIEHVGGTEAQLAHLREVRRVLKLGGNGYLAVPNRWMLVEPHYKLPFLSWLPKNWRTSYLRAFGKGEIYDCEPLRLKQLELLFKNAGLNSANISIKALRATFDIEQGQSVVTQLLKIIPDSFMVPFQPIIPTLIYQFSRPAVSSK